MMRSFLLSLITFSLFSTTTQATTYPITVQSCGQPVTITHRPEHAVIHDINMADMAFALHLQPYIAGFSGLSGWNKLTPAFKKQQQNIPEIAPRYPTMEQLLAAKTDLFFAGWNYGMHPGGDVTPETLAAQGIPTLVLSESCFRNGQKPVPATLDLLYQDELRLGQVFDRETEAQALITGWKKRVTAVQHHLKNTTSLRVFLYDSGLSTPFTAGGYALASTLISMGGGENIFKDLPASWGNASWEAAALQDPEAILIIDYGQNRQNIFNFLQHHNLMSETQAFKNRKILFVRYDEMTPSPYNIDAIEKIAAFLHPDVKL
ncbi:ABC transporter substrate-binding protein [Acetobacter thailandicus]|uniref:ABC transporter substrate-binding protein n=1 Tax=Acetobacter thailandicus TaxID=1502842 RepID=UPI0020131D92|nr:ABC transporter substrate-binding protein [Acetobacter thailandicus]